MAKPVALITGVGDSTGAALARRFAAGGYRVAMIARNGDRLKALEKEIEGSRAFVCDLGDLEALDQTVKAVQASMGPPKVLVHNAVAHTFATFLEADPTELERNFRVNTTALLILSRKDARARRLRDTLAPLSIGLLLAILQVALISLVRFSATGTMTGFPGL